MSSPGELKAMRERYARCAALADNRDSRFPSSESARFFPGDASSSPFDAASFDIVYQSTVFSSILDDLLQARVVTAIWRWFMHRGVVLRYDFAVNNPNNPAVRGAPLVCVRALFPVGRISHRWLTLAPPIARAVTRLYPGLYTVLNALPLLRTYVLRWIQKT